MPISFRQKIDTLKKTLPTGKFFWLAASILLLIIGGFFYLAQPAAKPSPEKVVKQSQQEIIATPKDTPSNEFSFAVIGDTQRFEAKNVDGGLQQSVASLEKKNVSFLVVVGDLVSSCDGGRKCQGKFTAWKNILGPLFAHTYAVLGNHDRTSKEKADALWQKFFTLPENGPPDFQESVYSFDFKNSHFVVLNSEKPKEHSINLAQRDWLAADLAANNQSHTFVFFHEPAYPTKSKIGSSLDHNEEDRDALWQILEHYRVDAVFSGHEHIQSHKKIGTVDQFIFGNTDAYDHELPAANPTDFAYAGKGFGLVSVSAETVRVEFYTASGELLKTIPLAK